MTAFKLSLLLMFLAFHFRANTQTIEYDSIIKERLELIQKGLNSVLFVNRYESIETPCVCIDSTDHTTGHVYRRIINSNYRIQLNRTGRIDTSGVLCLSKFYSKYIKLDADAYDTQTQILTGRVSLTYGYPASSIIQYLGFTYNAEDKQNAFYGKLLKSVGWFSLYPEGDKYKIKVSLDSKPYNKKDTFYGYLEIVKGLHAPASKISYQVFFDQMNLFRGDRNNQIFLRFTSTSFSDEAVYFTNLVFNTLKHENSSQKDKKYAEAIWLRNFLADPKCPQCSFIFKQAEYLVQQNKFSLPSTEPIPAH